MSTAEVALHARKRIRQFRDTRIQPAQAGPDLGSPGAFPRLPGPQRAPDSLKTALRERVEQILEGSWRAFGYLELKVDDPPKWHFDYLAGMDVSNSASAFRLNHRELPAGADIKLIWELSRWYELVRLAQAAYLFEDRRSAQKCLIWLDDWLQINPPYRGWNWTSALESGLRLIQFCWIDALLDSGAATESEKGRLARLRSQILPAHVRYTWRYRSFGSSANNHLLGELTGLILAVARWPALAGRATSLSSLQSLWEREVLAQFAPDGGNREQALNYQLFALEFCLQSGAALQSAGRSISAEVLQRISQAAKFYLHLQVPDDPWDFGDSDNAFVTPFFARENQAIPEWHLWLAEPAKSSAIQYWLGPSTNQLTRCSPPLEQDNLWRHFEDSGYSVAKQGQWRLRLDWSPLGYLETAAHGHLDALHVSLWWRGVAFLIDPGTGAYYADPPLRAWLASREAHNGPALLPWPGPYRLGSFLWSAQHARPQLVQSGQTGVSASLSLHNCELRRE
ncbi:MAG TPA: heparinase II/III family protein, partial [Verrucomicrobiae bacterium]|nr:heparinase II/III family protein [Verrucomicrobiae bacterium]